MMTDQDQPKSASTDTEGVLDAEEQSTAPAAQPVVDELTQLRAEVAALRDRNLRLVAEQQNQQKRAQREKQEALRYAEAEFARELLIILDDLERTQEAAQNAVAVAAVADGVRIVHEHFLKVLRQFGIQPIEAAGQPFDPSIHEALLQQPSADHPAGSVLQELARGYTMHERVLRPSRVIVSSGPAAEAGATAPRDAAADKES
ncbi:MAG: nucleotide exchange factor GrpE [Phycisphaerales bacterium]|nr:nucleotide exchange factor GrpE [Phycisphaerales bacterium]